jgi:TRAP-type mannitol/chloroaromatic compound transport system permease small subunit
VPRETPRETSAKTPEHLRDGLGDYSLNGLLALSRGIDIVNERIGRLACWLTFIVVLVACANAILRYGFRVGSNTFIDLQWYMFALIFLYGAAYTLLKGGHVRVDVLYGRFTPQKKAWVDILGGLLFFLPTTIGLTILSIPMVMSSIAVWEQSGDVGGLPRWPIKLAIPIAFALLSLQGVSEIIKRVAFLRGLAPEPVYRKELQ